MNRATRNLLVVAAALLAILLAGCSDETAPRSITSSVTPVAARPATGALTPVVLGQCQSGMTLQPGEGCTYSGGGKPPASVLLSVDLDGSSAVREASPK